MKKQRGSTTLWLIVFILFIVIMTNANAVVPKSKPTRYEIQVTGEVSTSLVDNARVASCKLLTKLSKVVCPSPMTVPLVSLSGLMPDAMWGGYIPEGTVVYLSDKLIGPHYDVFAHGVLVHEIVHWAVFWSGTELSVCENEELAWKVFNYYVTVEGRKDLAHPNWVQGYPQCWGEVGTKDDQDEKTRMIGRSIQHD